MVKRKVTCEQRNNLNKHNKSKFKVTIKAKQKKEIFVYFITILFAQLEQMG